MMEIVIFVLLFSIFSGIVQGYDACKYELIGEGDETTLRKDLILNLHNGFRQMALDGEIDSQPRAEPGSIKMLKWHSLLAREALEVAKTCNFGHIRINMSEFAEGVGQNLFRSCSNKKKVPDWKRALNYWFREYEIYSFPDTPDASNGHYTQLIWDNTEFVGCGFSQYIRNEKRTKTPFCTLYVCNYGPTGNIEGVPPYQPVILDMKNNSEPLLSSRILSK